MDIRSAIKAVGAIVMAIFTIVFEALDALSITTQVFGQTIDWRWSSLAAFIAFCGFIWWTRESSFVRDYKLTLGGLEELSEAVANSP